MSIALFRLAAGVTLATLAASPAAAGTPAFTGIAARADTAETSISNPTGMSRLDAPTSTVRLVLAQGLGRALLQ